jgi:hypothetical protein
VVVVACLGYSLAGAGMLVFSKETPDLLATIAGCLQRLGGIPSALAHGHLPLIDADLDAAADQPGVQAVVVGVEPQPGTLGW